MREFIWISIFLIPQFLWSSPGYNTYLLKPKSEAILIEGFTSTQKALWNDYLSSSHLSEFQPGQIATFASVTHALEHTYLTHNQNALNMIYKITEVNGEIPTAASYQQFNLAVIWKPRAISNFRRSGFTYRMGFGHANESGVSYHSDSYGVHVLYDRNNLLVGHVHVDYRYFSLEASGEGHFHPYNADVRALGPQLERGQPIDNYLRHVQWYGAIPNYNR